MMIFKSASALIVLGVIIAVHIISRLISGIAAKVLAFVNIGLHIALFFVLMIAEIPIAEAVLAYMISVFVYVLVFFVMHIISARGECARCVKEEENDL